MQNTGQYKPIVVVGCGLTGTYIARELAEAGYKVKIVEKREHIGGNLYDSINTDTGCRIQNYGPHIFHTSDDWVWEYVNKYTEFTPFKLTSEIYFPQYKKFVPGPFNFGTIDLLYDGVDGTLLKTRLLEYFNIDVTQPADKRTISIVDLMNSKDKMIQEFAQILWENDYKLYTAKQWGIQPEKVDYNILSRVPFYCSYHSKIFNDTYEGVPKDGFTKMFENMLNHPNIEVCLSENALEHTTFVANRVYYKWEEVCLIWTGAIDELFEYCYGALPYKTVDFKYAYAPHNKQADYGDPCSSIFPDLKHKFTRITNFGRLPIQNHLGLDVLLYEYPRDFVLSQDAERYYPTSSERNKALYEKYRQKAQHFPHLFLAGRLAEYKYYDMDKALLSAKDKVEHITKQIKG